VSGLAGRSVLIVEDEYFIAIDLREALERAGAEVVGPVGTAAEATALIAASPPDLAVLDINLRGKMSFDVADALAARHIGFIFATGYDGRLVPERHAGRVLVQKPAHAADIVAALARTAAD
jgi:DNA-binding NarL/FixJ family response regulator